MELVKILTDEDGAEVEPVWHLVYMQGGVKQTFCTGQVFGLWVGAATYDTKSRKSGGITCTECLDRIKWAKSIRL